MTTDKRPLDVAELRDLADEPWEHRRCTHVRAALRQAAAEIDRLRVENATLGEAFTSAKERADRWIDDAAKYKADVEKLRALLRASVAVCQEIWPAYDAMRSKLTGDHDVRVLNKLDAWRKAGGEVEP